ncbi:T9SS type A sorting domain-containing protein [Fluviicola sp.]|uniref:Ig-like domain-containing protein n=1 Tax=Fluviicola sp. TaxID=1917219 RepID=UPI003D289B45
MKQLITIAFLLISSAGIAQSYSGGSGTVADPYLIANKADLKYLSENLSEVNKHFLQTANILFTSADFAPGGDFYNGGFGFDPIGGNINQYFIGTYDGNHFFIDSLYINRPNEDGIGFFASVNHPNAEVRAVDLRNVTITGQSYIGVISGIVSSGASILNCSVTGTISGQTTIGGLIGEVDLATVNNCFTRVNVNGGDLVAGLIAYASEVTISNCSTSGNLTGQEQLGGLVATIHDSFITNCYSLAAVSGTNYVGGLVGNFGLGSIVITNCYAVGAVSGTSFVGGLIGTLTSGNTVNNSFWDVETTGQLVSSGGTPKSTLEMRTQSTFTTATWDFISESVNGTEDIWKMGECKNNGYPVFSWQTSEVYPDLTFGSINGNVLDSTTICYNESANIHAMSWYNVTWHDSITAGNLVSTSSPFTTPNLTDTTIYYAQADNGTCINPFRLAFTVVVRPENITNQTFEFCGSGSVTVGTNTYTTTGVYTDVFTDANSCDSTIITTLIIHPDVNTGVTVDSLTISALGTGTYQWINCATNTAIPGETAQTFTGTAGGSYAVVVSNGSCSDTSGCVSITTVGLTDLTANSNFRAYPNPTKGSVTIDLGVAYADATVVIKNAIGQVVCSQSIGSSGKTDCSIAGEAGIYFLEVKTDGQRSVLKLVKE